MARITFSIPSAVLQRTFLRQLSRYLLLVKILEEQLNNAHGRNSDGPCMRISNARIIYKLNSRNTRILVLSISLSNRRPKKIGFARVNLSFSERISIRKFLVNAGAVLMCAAKTSPACTRGAINNYLLEEMLPRSDDPFFAIKLLQSLKAHNGCVAGSLIYAVFTKVLAQSIPLARVYFQKQFNNHFEQGHRLPPGSNPTSARLLAQAPTR